MKKNSHQKASDILKVYGLGRFIVKYGDMEKNIDDWTSNKALRMFKYFLLNRNKDIYNEELVEVFWPEIDPETGKKRLYNTIYLLRKNIGIKDIVINKTTSYKFNDKYTCWVDWEQFNNIYENLNNSITIEELKTAVELYHGELMPGLRYEYWVEELRTNLQEKYLDIILKLSEKLYEKGEYIEALIYLKKGINEEPYREEYYNLAMKILTKTGRIYEAIAVYEKYKNMISNELGIEPSPEIIATYKKIKNSDLVKQHNTQEINARGALKCDREVFNKIFELENRQVKRTDKNFTLLTIDFEELEISHNFDNLCEEMGELFRSGDVICCYKNKIDVLLHDMNVEKTNYILNRIFEYLKEKNIHHKPTFDFKEIDGK